MMNIWNWHFKIGTSTQEDLLWAKTVSTFTIKNEIMIIIKNMRICQFHIVIMNKTLLHII